VSKEDVKLRSPSIVAQMPDLANDPASMSVDELWTFHSKVGKLLAEKITAELNHLKGRLALLNPGVEPRANRNASKEAGSLRRPYPRVLPKYRNPDSPSETWAGRGRQPQWVKMQLRSGNRLDDFLISKPEKRSPARAR
jgi:DNA-binding protein H-NS